MARRKTFSTYVATPAEPVELVINDQTFRCQESLPGQVLLDFLAETKMDDPASMVSAINNIFKQAVVEEDYEAWSAFIRDPANNISLNNLSEFAGWLVEEYTGRPS